MDSKGRAKEEYLGPAEKPSTPHKKRK